jgi:8-oxo-dGTP pyrophosphatase MutT (NUDIX family)
LIKGNLFTKFPGGGLEFGEGTRACLAREFKEETGLEVSIGNHIYTTDFFQASAFNKLHQIISIYYNVIANDITSLKTSSKKFDFSAEQIADKSTNVESFRWVNWDELDASVVNLPIDKVVVDIIKKFN